MCWEGSTKRKATASCWWSWQDFVSSTIPDFSFFSFLYWNSFRGLYWDTGIGEGTKVTVKDLLKSLYDKAICHQKNWALVRHIAGILRKRVEDLTKVKCTDAKTGHRWSNFIVQTISLEWEVKSHLVPTLLPSRQRTLFKGENMCRSAQSLPVMELSHSLLSLALINCLKSDKQDFKCSGTSI